MKFLISTLLLTSLLFCERTTGKIVDIHGNPIKGAIISHQNTSTHSDEDGTFRLKSGGKGRVSVEHIGYKTITLEHSKYMRVVMQQRVILTEDVIVTSQLKSTSIKDINSSISIFEPENIKKIESDHLQSHLHQISNLNWSGATSRPRYFQIRGIGEKSQYTGEGPPNFSVGFSIDDIDLSGIGMAATMFDLNQIEILKGSQSSVFGANALAGAICLKSKNPDPFLGGHFILGYGSDNNQRIGVALNTPLSSKFMIRTGIFYSAGDGFRENLYLNRTNTNAKSESMIRTKLNWTMSKNSDIKITIMLSDLDNRYDAWTPDNNENLYTYSDRQGYDSQQLTAVSVRSSFRYDSGHKILSISSKSRSAMEHSYDGDWGNIQFWEDDPYSWDSYYYGYYLPYDYYDKTTRDRETTSYELRLLSPDRGKKNYTYALGLYHKSLTESDQMNGWIFNGDVDQFDGEFNISNLALYGKVDLLFNQGLGLDFSARGEIVSLDYAATSLKDLDYDGVYETSYISSVDDMMDLLLGLKGVIYYDITEADRVFASISRGYKAGGVNQNPFISDQNQYYDPEQNISFELGYKSFKEKSSYQATFFYMLREDLQVSVSAQQDPGNPNSFYYFTSNATSGHNYGAEYERSQVFLDDKLKLTSSIGYLKTWIDRYEFYIDEGTPITRGNRAQSQSPEFSYSMITEIHPSKSVTIAIDYSFKDKYFLSDSHDHRSEAYHLLNLSAEYKINSASISLWMRNVTDVRYAIRGFYFGLEPPNFEDKLYLQWGDPMHLGFSLRYDF